MCVNSAIKSTKSWYLPPNTPWKIIISEQVQVKYHWCGYVALTKHGQWSCPLLASIKVSCNMIAFFSFDLFMLYMYQNASNWWTAKKHADTKYCTLLIWALVLLLSVSHAIINDLDVILHGFMLQVIYSTIFLVKRLNNLISRFTFRLFKR